MNGLPASLLFACSENSVRSPMAEALAKRLYGQLSYLDSVGVRASDVDGFGTAAEVEYWPVTDPSAVEGTRETRLDAYRRMRDQILARLKTRFGAPSGPS